ncbi:MAG: type IV pilus twitching motility protein PilT [Oligoflexales bacterium]|nr:type IV pilus twitching motility protein PilT [Oligoflexales bacterium]
MSTRSTELNYSLPQLLKALLDQNGSDLHITSNSPPRLRINGLLLPLDLPPLTGDQTMLLCYSILTEEQKKNFEGNKEIDLSFSIKGLCRFRANIFHQRGTIGGVFRVIPTRIPEIKELGLPQHVEDFCKIPRGLVLVTGPTGSGKSTTLASMVDNINNRYQKHIVTIEDPIEFMHANKHSIVNQRELGSDTDGFSKALKSCLRQDPDVVLVGELRDLETIALAITTAETGHLVFGTLHTNSCVSSINRIVDAFPSHQQAQVRTQLSFTLMGVMSQLLIPSLDGRRVACIEMMVPNAAIRNLIRDNKIHQIYSAMQIGQESSHMRTMNQALLDLVTIRKINEKTALGIAQDPIEMAELLNKHYGRVGTSGNKPRR